MLPLDSTVLRWRGQTVALCPEPYQAYVYLIHFGKPIGNAASKHGLALHYCGSTGALEYRLFRHKNGSGAALMRAVKAAGISWQLARLWRFETCAEARAWEKRLKRRGHNPQQCPLCNLHLAVDPYTFMRQGHSPILSRPQGKRRSLQSPVPHFVSRVVGSRFSYGLSTPEIR